MVRSTRAGRQAEEEVKKGPWTPEEDQKLIAYIQEHGHGNWRALPKKSGLQRCGKSCRLRWTNYLRPDIKRGLFTNSEKQKIIQLHALVGNRWAFIASQLPNRTDNEIKNYWNTVLKKTAMTLTPPRSLKRGPVPHSNRSPNYCPASVICRSSCSRHLAQWETVRLQAEARLSATSTLPHSLRLFSRCCNSTGSPTPPVLRFSSTAASVTTLIQPASYISPHASPNSTLGVTTSPPNSLSCISNPNVAHTHSPLVYAANPFNVINPCILPSTSSVQSSHAALALGPNGQLSWKNQELSFKDPPNSLVPCNNLSGSQYAINDNVNSKGIDVDLTKAREGHKAISPVEATCSSLDLNSMISLSSSYSWHELLFEVENGCSSEVVSPFSGHEPKSPKGSHSHGEKVIQSRSVNESCKGSHAPHMQDSNNMSLESGLIRLHEEIDMTHMDVEILASIMD